MDPYDSLAAYTFPAIESRGLPSLRRTRTREVEAADGYARQARIPSPLAMAETLARPLIEERFGDVHRLPSPHRGRPAQLVTSTGEAIGRETIRDLVADALMAIPARPDVDTLAPYASFVAVVAEAPDGAWVRQYADDVATAAHLLGVFPAREKAPEPRVARGAAKTPAQWKAAQRARERAAEEASVRDWLALYLSEASPGERVSAPELHELASEAIEDLIADEDDPGRADGSLWRVPGPRTFYAVADEVLGGRLRGAQGARHYIIPSLATTAEEAPMSISDQLREENDLLEQNIALIRDRTAALLEAQHTAHASGDVRSALLAQRERVGNVTFLRRAAA